MSQRQSSIARRQFLKGMLATAGLAATPMGMASQLGLGQQLVRQGRAFNDYKALVCVFLYGGHDSLNLLVPTDTAEHSVYAQVRQTLAYEQSALNAITPIDSPTYNVGMPNFATSLYELFNQQKLSVVSNVGPMTHVANKAQYQANESLLPPQLFSHNDQQSLWQSGLGRTDATTGWAGRMADLIMDTSNPLSMNITTDGTNLWQAGFHAKSFAVNTDGPENFGGLNPAEEWNQTRYNTFQRLLGINNHPMMREYANRIRGAETNNRTIAVALESIDESAVAYPEQNRLSGQLKMVANLIQTQAMLGHDRQVFFVGLGGFDTHDNQVDLLPGLVNSIGDALLAFQNDLTLRGVSQNVVTFTQSDFGRTLTSNGDGTDHGWGGHQLVMGDAVRGGNIIGALPDFALGSDDDIGGGRIIPTIAVDQYGADLASWFGLTPQEVNEVFPNLANLGRQPLGLFT